jgi:hypothetical protein
MEDKAERCAQSRDQYRAVLSWDVLFEPDAGFAVFELKVHFVSFLRKADLLWCLFFFDSNALPASIMRQSVFIQVTICLPIQKALSFLARMQHTSGFCCRARGKSPVKKVNSVGGWLEGGEVRVEREGFEVATSCPESFLSLPSCGYKGS